MEGFDVETEVGDDAITEEVAIGVGDGEGVARSGGIDGEGEGDGTAVGDDDAVEVGEKLASGVGVLVWIVAGHPASGAGTRSSGLLICG